MIRLFPVLAVSLALAVASLPARAEDPPLETEEGPAPEESAAPGAGSSSGEASTPGGAITTAGSPGSAAGSISGAGIHKGAKDKSTAPSKSSVGKGGGGGSVPAGESLNGLGEGDPACNGLPAQSWTTAVKEARRLDGSLSTNKKSPDAIDLHKVTVVKGANIADWPITSKLKDVKITGREICIDHDNLGSGKWNTLFFDDKDVPIEGNQWIFAFIKGRWYGGAGEWIRPAQLCKAVDSANVGCGVFYDSEPLKSWRPAHGELVGVAVSAPARAGQWGKAERTNVLLVPWP